VPISGMPSLPTIARRVPQRFPVLASFKRLTPAHSACAFTLIAAFRAADGRLFLRRRVRPSDANGPTTSFRSNTPSRKLAGCRTFKSGPIQRLSGWFKGFPIIDSDLPNAEHSLSWLAVGPDSSLRFNSQACYAQGTNRHS
jgi:hypothetical protein